MKNLLTTFCFLTLYLIAPAQDKEFTGGINTGFFSFRGKSAVNTSFINVSDVTSIPNYTNDIYSKKAGAGIGINFSLQKVTKAKIIYGLSAAIEILKSKISIDAVAGVRGSSGLANGKVTLTSKFVTISPAIGYLFVLLRTMKKAPPPQQIVPPVHFLQTKTGIRPDWIFAPVCNQH